MAKKLVDIKSSVEAQSAAFHEYFYDGLDEALYEFITNLQRNHNLYVFSGVIRDFFLDVPFHRDIDLVIDGDIDESLLSKCTYKRNSYGGYKIKVNNVSVDLWSLNKTWAFTYQKSIEFQLERELPNTAFFNFSSIIFSLAENKFLYSKHFLRFLRDKEINIVYKPNANQELCVINSFYYADKLKYRMGKDLIKYLKQTFKHDEEKYDYAQILHFGKILYSINEIENRINSLS